MFFIIKHKPTFICFYCIWKPLNSYCMKTLSKTQFLPVDKKAQYVWKKGTYCYSYWEGNYRIHLYWVEDCLAQIWLDDEDNQVRNVVFKQASQECCLLAS